MRKIEVVEYDSIWKEKFLEEKKRLYQALGTDLIIDVHHIGSTSVPNLAAKAVIDICLEVDSLEGLDISNRKMEEIGYEACGEFGIPGRRFFKKGGDKRSHHIHAFLSGNPHLYRHIAFRDYLIRHPNIAQHYAVLKKQVAASCQHDNEKYCAGKDAFIKHHEKLAVQEQTEQDSA